MFAKDNSRAPVLSVCGVGSLCTEGYILLLGLHPLPLSRNLFIQHISSEGAKKVLHTAKWPALPLPQAVWGVRFMVLDGT